LGFVPSIVSLDESSHGYTHLNPFKRIQGHNRPSSEGSVKFIENRVRRSPSDPIGLETLSRWISTLNVLKLQIERIRMFVQSPAELGYSIGQYP